MSHRIEAITNLYRLLLNREPDPTGLSNYFNSNLSIEQIKSEILNSQEFKTISPFSIEPFGVTDITRIKDLDKFYGICNLFYKHLLKFPPIESLIKYWYFDGDLNDIENDIISSSEYINNNSIRTEVKEALAAKIDSGSSIISNNCIGNFISKIILNQNNLSPTVNSVMKTNDFIKYVNNIKYYTSLNAVPNVIESNNRNYSVIDLDDIQIYFIHSSPNMCHIEAKLWNDRSKRINFDKLLVVFRERFDGDDISDNLNDAKTVISKILNKKLIISDDSDIKDLSINFAKSFNDLDTWYNQIDKIKNMEL